MSEESPIHSRIRFWTSGEIINETHLNDDNRISEYHLFDQAMGHRFCIKSSIREGSDGTPSFLSIRPENFLLSTSLATSTN